MRYSDQRSWSIHNYILKWVALQVRLSTMIHHFAWTGTHRNLFFVTINKSSCLWKGGVSGYHRSRAITPSFKNRYFQHLSKTTFHPLCPLLNSFASHFIHGWNSWHVRCQDPSNFTASSAYPLAPVRSPLKYNTWRDISFQVESLQNTIGPSGSMFVWFACMFYLCQKKIYK